MRRRRQGGRPQVLLNALRSARSLTAMTRQSSEMWRGLSSSASTSISTRCTRLRLDVPGELPGASEIPTQGWMFIHRPCCPVRHCRCRFRYDTTMYEGVDIALWAYAEL